MTREGERSKGWVSGDSILWTWDRWARRRLERSLLKWRGTERVGSRKIPEGWVQEGGLSHLISEEKKKTLGVGRRLISKKKHILFLWKLLEDMLFFPMPVACSPACMLKLPDQVNLQCSKKWLRLLLFSLQCGYAIHFKFNRDIFFCLYSISPFFPILVNNFWVYGIWMNPVPKVKLYRKLSLEKCYYIHIMFPQLSLRPIGNQSY